ncbi:ABC transporter ATP-binding protein [Spirochaeta cellobiosiphila]|uniref:ABC transporter ATP-binding protein n=1 Tax=Spirochaeta cellobiosiphila TaxID=504483 RepID=UPI000415ED82|nr:ABC transporter ATP-binding protein [Spirochaeta cellobiosiphila]
MGKLLKLFLGPYGLWLIATIICVFGQSMGELYLPNLMSDIVNKGITNSDIDYITRTGILMLLVTIGGAICAIIASYLSSHLAIGFCEDLRTALFTKVSNFSLHEFDKFGTPSLVTRSTNDVTQIQNVMVIVQRMMFRAPVTAIGGMILALQKDKGLAWIIFIAIPVLGISIGLVAAKGFPLFQSIQKKVDHLNLLLRENLTGIRVIRAFDKDEYEEKRFTTGNEDLMKTSVRVNRIFALLFPLMMFIMNGTTIAILWFGSHRVDRGLSNIGDMIAFLQYGMQILGAFIMASVMFIMIPRAQASAERINEVLETESDLNDPEVSVTPETDYRGHVEFRNVSFHYHGAESPALSKVSFTTGPGETTAIIGSTGSGKSTLLSLIPRFYDISEGEILVDGVNVKDMTQKDLRSRIGYVPQKALLFTGSVADNIRYGDETASDEEVARAARIAQAEDFISDMPLKFDSPISQGGSNVSGGQKQRLSIARALVRRPEIYLFDDSFSALDVKTDANLREALGKETKEATVIIVGQRVSSIMNSDRIIVLDEGQVVGVGTHTELCRTCQVYKEIVNSQLTEEETA